MSGRYRSGQRPAHSRPAPVELGLAAEPGASHLRCPPAVARALDNGWRSSSAMAPGKDDVATTVQRGDAKRVNRLLRLRTVLDLLRPWPSRGRCTRSAAICTLGSGGVLRSWRSRRAIRLGLQPVPDETTSCLVLMASWRRFRAPAGPSCALRHGLAHT